MEKKQRESTNIWNSVVETEEGVAASNPTQKEYKCNGKQHTNEVSFSWIAKSLHLLLVLCDLFFYYYFIFIWIRTSLTATHLFVVVVSYTVVLAFLPLFVQFCVSKTENRIRMVQKKWWWPNCANILMTTPLYLWQCPLILYFSLMQVGEVPYAKF